jgi:hypothetical protein
MVEVRVETGYLYGAVCWSVVMAFMPMLIARGLRHILRLIAPPGIDTDKDD